MTSLEATLYLGQKQIDLYRSAPEVYIRAFKAGAANREIIRQYYGIMVRKGLIMALEATDPEYNAGLKELTIELADRKLDLTGCLNMAKLLHIIANHV